MGIAESFFILFAILKFMGKIDWSWWAVAAPMWMFYGTAAIYTFVKYLPDAQEG